MDLIRVRGFYSVRLHGTQSWRCIYKAIVLSWVLSDGDQGELSTGRVHVLYKSIKVVEAFNIGWDLSWDTGLKRIYNILVFRSLE